MPKGAIVIIGHRMHDADLQGRLLDEQAAGGDRWEVVELPAISPEGEALWPEWYPLTRWSASGETRSRGSGPRSISRTRPRRKATTSRPSGSGRLRPRRNVKCGS